MPWTWGLAYPCRRLLLLLEMAREKVLKGDKNQI